ncbi:flagellin [Deferribacterales bacterium RsTz2092]
MSFSVYTNTAAVLVQGGISSSAKALSHSIEGLSSGLRINHASDDASGIAISDKLRTQISGLSKATANAQDAISYLQTMDGALGVVNDMLLRMRELSVQAGGGSYTSNDRAELQKEIEALKGEVNRVSLTTEFNTKRLLDGSNGVSISASSGIDVALISYSQLGGGGYYPCIRRLQANI